MERDEATSSKGLFEGDRGAGGKFRNPTVRKPPTTPYTRPSTQTRSDGGGGGGGGGGGWLSKIVNPATRLISGGATRLFPSFFSKPLSVSDEEEEAPEVEQDVREENLEHLSNIQICRSTEKGKDPASKCGSDMDGNFENKLGNSSDSNNFDEIEQMMKGKTFSRDDINRLTEILLSRVADRSEHDEQRQKNLNIIGADAIGRSLGKENIRTSLVEKQSMHCQDMRASAVEKQLSHSDKIMGVMSTPGPFGQDKVSASPIDIAKAYMGSRTSELGLSSPSVIFKDERTPIPTDGFSLKPSVPSSSPKSSIRWPGAKVQDQLAYQTPQTQRARIGLHNLPRTPYSRAVHTRSTSKLQDGGDRSINISSNYWNQSRTPIFGDSQAMRTRNSDDGPGSVGPMRRMRQKFVGATPSKGAASSSRPSNSVSFRMEGSDAPKGFSPMVKQNLELGGSSSNSRVFHPVDSKTPDSSLGGSTVHPQSSEMARKILEGLDRSIITPQKKSAELKLATSWRKTTSSELTNTVPNGQFNEQLAESSNLQSSHITQQFSAQRKEVTGSSLSELQSEQSKNDKATDAVNPYTWASNGGASTMTGNGADSVGFSANPFMDFKKTHNAHEVTEKQTEHLPSDNNQPLPQQNHIDGGDVSRLLHWDGNSESLNGHKRTATHTFGNKPALTSISVAKADPKRTVSFDNGSGFTFPVSASSGTLSEPPTPSIMPSFSAIGVPRPLEKPALPPYNFGSKATDGSIMPSVSAVGVLRPLEKPALPPYNFGLKTGTRAIVFSFPCTSSSSPGDGSTPKFDFGSDTKSRLSFRSVEEDAICY